jgi:aspartokinase
VKTNSAVKLYSRSYKIPIICKRSNDYQVIGTLIQSSRKRKSYNNLPLIEMLEDLHDFTEVVTYVPAEQDSGERIEHIFKMP